MRGTEDTEAGGEGGALPYPPVVPGPVELSVAGVRVRLSWEPPAGVEPPDGFAPDGWVHRVGDAVWPPLSGPLTFTADGRPTGTCLALLRSTATSAVLGRTPTSRLEGACAQVTAAVGELADALADGAWGRAAVAARRHRAAAADLVRWRPRRAGCACADAGCWLCRRDAFAARRYRDAELALVAFCFPPGSAARRFAEAAAGRWPGSAAELRATAAAVTG